MTHIAGALTSAIGDPFEHGTQHGPLVSQTPLDVRPILVRSMPLFTFIFIAESVGIY